MKQYLFGFSIICCLLIFSCNQKKQKETYTEDISASDAKYELWADTIIYEVLVHNPDSTDQWQSHKIARLNHKKMVDDIFASVYSGQKKAYNYYTNEIIDIDDIKALEEDFKRDDVGKIQFSETWRYNITTGNLEKKIHSILVAYILYNSKNEIRGYKAAFYVKN